MNNNKLIGGISLVAGTTIGAAMLALPLSTGLGGFFPALFVFVFCWAAMYWTACLFVEINLAFDHEVNLVSMARLTLGPVGAVVAWVGFLMLLYSLIAAYVAGLAPLIQEGCMKAFGYRPSVGSSILWTLALLSPVVYAGIRAVDFVNRYFVLGLIIAYTALIFLLCPKVDLSLLAYANVAPSFSSLAVVVTAFGFHMIIPSLATYFERDVKVLKRCLLLGSSIPLLVYVIWEFLILGIIPVEGPNGLIETREMGHSLTLALSGRVGGAFVGVAMGAFSLFAIATSFLGVSQSLFDFLKDGMKVSNTHKGRLFVLAVAFIPPVLFLIWSEHGFVQVLQYAGVFVAVLIGVLPILMTWSLRYFKCLPSSYRAPGGKLALSMGLLFFVFVIVLSFINS